MNPASAACAAALALWAAPAGAVSFFPPNPFSDMAAGTTSAAFLKQAPGARAQALAGSFAAVSGDPDSVFWNPSGLAFVSSSGFGLSYNALLETLNSGSLYYVFKAAGGDVLGLGLLYQGQSPLEGYNSVGDPTGNFQAYDYCPSIVFGKAWGGVSVGTGLKWVRSFLAGQTGGGPALDAGILGKNVGRLADGMVDVGAYVQNLGPPLNLSGQADPLPFQGVAGMLWKARPGFRIAVDAHLPADQSPYVSAGGEYVRAWSGTAFALRAGYSVKTRRNLSGAAGLTGGFGLGFQQLRVDYAWVPFGDLGSTHRLSLSWRL